jgi:hypothetical protein
MLIIIYIFMCFLYTCELLFIFFQILLFKKICMKGIMLSTFSSGKLLSYETYYKKMYVDAYISGWFIFSISTSLYTNTVIILSFCLLTDFRIFHFFHFFAIPKECFFAFPSICLLIHIGKYFSRKNSYENKFWVLPSACTYSNLLSCRKVFLQMIII